MKSHSKTYYNDIALKLIQKLFGLDYLHYGYFEPNIPHTLEGLKEAQQKYTDKILSHFPNDAKNILDVGCGAGGNAKTMVKKGYNVTCIDPDPYLLNRTATETQNKVRTFQGMYENVSEIQPESMDLVLMSESCQYISPVDGWNLHKKHVHVGGYVMAVDFFKIRPIDKPFISKSGHELNSFIEEAEKKGFKLLLKEDITPQTAPTMDLYQSIITDKIFPVFEALFTFIERKFTFIYKILAHFLKDKIVFLKEKYSNQGSDTFSHYKGYYILLFQRVK
jgi:MPBQ/MSBQ methyltransferase